MQTSMDFLNTNPSQTLIHVGRLKTGTTYAFHVDVPNSITISNRKVSEDGKELCLKPLKAVAGSSKFGLDQRD